MNRRTRFHYGLFCSGLAVLAGCAEVPPTPDLPMPVVRSPQEEQIGRSIARHRQLAAQYKQSGDLASAATQWKILALLAPHDDAIRHELTAMESTIGHRVQENLAAGTNEWRSGDIDRAADTMLKVLALDPENVEAARMLRDIEKRRLSKIQAARAAKVNAAAAGQSSATRSQPAAAGSGNGFDLELPLEIFKAGDTAGGLRDLRRFVDANPNDRSARQRVGAAVYDRARELEEKGMREQALALYEQAVSLRGDSAPGWNARIQSLRKALGQAQEKANRGQ